MKFYFHLIFIKIILLTNAFPILLFIQTNCGYTVPSYPKMLPKASCFGSSSRLALFPSKHRGLYFFS